MSSGYLSKEDERSFEKTGYIAKSVKFFRGPKEIVDETDVFPSTIFGSEFSKILYLEGVVDKDNTPEFPNTEFGVEFERILYNYDPFTSNSFGFEFSTILYNQEDSDSSSLFPPTNFGEEFEVVLFNQEYSDITNDFPSVEFGTEFQVILYNKGPLEDIVSEFPSTVFAVEFDQVLYNTAEIIEDATNLFPFTEFGVEFTKILYNNGLAEDITDEFPATTFGSEFEKIVYNDDPFTLNSLFSDDLVLWLESDSGLFQNINEGTAATDTDDPVGRWKDKSNALNHIDQNSTPKKPLLKKDYIRGHPAVYFDGDNDLLERLNIFTQSAGLVAIVLHITDRNLVATVFGGADTSVSNSSMQLIGRNGTNKMRLIRDANVINGSTVLQDNQSYIYIWRSNGSEYFFRLNQVQQVIEVDDISPGGANNGDWFDTVTGIDTISLGALKRDTELVHSQVAVLAVVAVDVDVSVADEETLENYLVDKYFGDISDNFVDDTDSFPSTTFASELSKVVYNEDPSDSNTPPSITIDSPNTGSIFRFGEIIAFESTVTDPDPGDNPTVQWHSNIDGLVGTGEDVNISNLSANEHTITATADDGKDTGQDQITITVYGDDTDSSPATTLGSEFDEVLYNEGTNLEDDTDSPPSTTFGSEFEIVSYNNE